MLELLRPRDAEGERRRLIDLASNNGAIDCLIMVIRLLDDHGAIFTSPVAPTPEEVALLASNIYTSVRGLSRYNSQVAVDTAPPTEARSSELIFVIPFQETSEASHMNEDASTSE